MILVSDQNVFSQFGVTPALRRAPRRRVAPISQKVDIQLVRPAVPEAAREQLYRRDGNVQAAEVESGQVFFAWA